MRAFHKQMQSMDELRMSFNSDMFKNNTILSKIFFATVFHFFKVLVAI